MVRECNVAVAYRNDRPLAKVREENVHALASYQRQCCYVVTRAIEETKRAMEDAALGERSNSPDDLQRKMQDVVRDVEAYEAELMKEVEAGRLSKDEFSQKLVAYSGTVMSRILGSGKNRNQKVDPRSERYSEIKASIDQAVESGELSNAEAEKKLIEARKSIFGR